MNEFGNDEALRRAVAWRKVLLLNYFDFFLVILNSGIVPDVEL